MTRPTPIGCGGRAPTSSSPPTWGSTLDTPEEVAAAIVRGATSVRTRNVRSARRVADVLAVVADVDADHDAEAATDESRTDAAGADGTAR